MRSSQPGDNGFKRQVVFRVGSADWPLLERAAREHGSIQAAMLAGLHALQTAAKPAERPRADVASVAKPRPRKTRPAASKPRESAPAAPAEEPRDPDGEIRAREATQLLGVKAGTASGYIRSGRLPGRYDGSPTWRGWVTTRAAVDRYRRARR